MWSISAYWLETRYAWIDYRRDLPWLFLRFKELSLRLLPDATLLSDRVWVGIPSCGIRKVRVASLLIAMARPRSRVIEWKIE